jgi:hypothetical protein
LAEALLAAAGRYLDRLVDADLDQMNFSDACKALAISARLGPPAVGGESAPVAPASTLRDQLAALLEQAYRENPASSTPAPVANS